MRYLIALLLLPAVLLGADTKFAVTAKSSLLAQPANTIDRVSKRTKYSATFEKDSIGSGRFITKIGAAPTHWDSAGTWKRLNFSKTQTAASKAALIDAKVVVDFDEEYNVGPFKVEYLSTEPGKMRYTKRGTSLEFIPAFDTTQVGIKLTIKSTGLKADYTLSETSPTRLAWKYILTGNDTTKALKEGAPIYGPKGQINGYLPVMTALDAALKVVPLVTTITKDSVIAVIDTAGAKFPIIVDPSVLQDTMETGDSSDVAGILSGVSQANWDSIRAMTTATGLSPAPEDNLLRVKAVNDNGSRINIMRGWLSFDLSGYSTGAVTIDSAKLHINIIYNANTEADTALFVLGTWSGVPDRGDFNSFAGWANGGVAYNVINMTDSLITSSTETGWKSLDFTAAGKDTLLSVIDSDTLRLMFMMAKDAGNQYSAVQNANEELRLSLTENNIEIFYSIGNQPGISTTADTLYASAKFVGTVDSTGGNDLTSWGVKYWLEGTADTVTITETGTQSTGTFVVSCDSLLLTDTSYVYKAWGTNAVGTSYGGLDTLDTTIGGSSTTVKVDGRTVSIVR